MPNPPDRYFALKRRVEALERRPTAAADTRPPRKSVWEIVQIFMPLASGVLLAAVGYMLTGAVEAGFKREQLQLTQVKEMRDLIATVVGERATRETALPAALTLSAYGPPAVAPLLTALISFSSDARGLAAERGLGAVGFSHREAVCPPLLGVLQNRSGRTSWMAYGAAIRLTGDLRCDEAQRVLAALDQTLSGAHADQISDWFAAAPVLDEAALEELRTDIAASLRSFGGRL